MRRLARYGTACVLTLVAALVTQAQAQTTQGVVLGRITDSATGSAVPSASVVCIREDTGWRSPAKVDSNGRYAVAALSPGRYTVTVEAPGYQSQQARALDLPVAGRVELNFRVRPLYDLWETGQYRSWVVPESQQALGFYGPDVDTSRIAVFNANARLTTPLENSRSDVITRPEIQSLPLTGRDVYAMLLLLPGVTSDTATVRGLGFSVNGQRPSASNFLLDGVENNNPLITGPLSAAAPEFIQEYRISTTNYSPEYGRTSGFVANVITRSGTNLWHGDAFAYLKNQWLDANGFQENAQGIARAPLTEWEPGVLASGPVIRNRLFVFGGFETQRFTGQDDPRLFALPTASFVNSTDPASFAGRYLRQFVPQSQPSGLGDYALARISPPANFTRLNGLLRADYSSTSGAFRVFSRLAIGRLDEPDLVFDPYPQFSTRYRQKSLSMAVGLNSQVGAAALNEFRISRTGDSVLLDSPQDGIPQLKLHSITMNDQSYQLLLPGSLSLYNYRNRGHNWEFLDNWTWIAGRHTAKIGAGIQQRAIDLRLAVYPQGQLVYKALTDFRQNQPETLQAEVDSQTLGPVSPDRSYRYRQLYAFAQDSFRATRRLTFDYGVRYDYFGSPVNTGPQKDTLIQLGSGQDIATRLAGATLAFPSNAGNQTIFGSLASNWAVRAGAAWDLRGNGRTLLRASYGIFYDSLFDNLWENIIQNRYQQSSWQFNQPVALPAPLTTLEAAGIHQGSFAFPNGLVFQPRMRAPRTQSFFAGLQSALKPGLTLEIDALASRGRQLITTDQVNRTETVSAEILDLDYRANQGSSDYSALVAALRFRRSRVSGQISYTWSHSIDNQSEPLADTFLSFNQLQTTAQPYTFISSFTQQFASGLDRGNSDFDQRQNLVFFATWQVPPLLTGSRLAGVFRNWTVSTLGAVRSGLPFTVYAIQTGFNGSVILINERADLLAPHQAYTSQPYPGGRILLNAAAFGPPQPNTVGTSGRNAFTGPGLFNSDASIARTFHPRASRESLSFTIRADFYNLLNHANLNSPESFFGNPQFGVALWGRTETNNAFPLLQPLSETARQIQLMLQVRF